MHKNAGRKKMHKGDETRSVQPEDFQKFLDEGFVFGMPDSYKQRKRKLVKDSFIRSATGKKWVTNGEVQKLVYPEEFEYYFSIGYVLGQTKQHNTNISNSKKGFVMSEEQKQKISKSGTGKKRTEETRKNISNSLKGKKKSPEQIEKMRISRLGQVFTDEWRQHISEGIKKAYIEGRRNPDTYGRKKGRLSRINGKLLRSRMELIYAAYLEYLSIPYETESIRVIGDDGHIKISDFSYMGKVIEIKMNWEFKSHNDELQIRKKAFEDSGYKFYFVTDKQIENILSELRNKTSGIDDVLNRTSPEYVLNWIYNSSENRFETTQEI